MNELEWIASADPVRMVQWLTSNRPVERISNRKLRLFMCACYRLCTNNGDHSVVADNLAACVLAEEYADNRATGDQLFGLYESMRTVLVGRCLVCPDNYLRPNAEAVADQFRFVSKSADLLRDIVGNPWRKVELPTQRIEVDADVEGGYPAGYRDICPWLTWEDGMIRKMAQAIYDGRTWDRLPILADALEDAGCTDDAILGHLRGPGPHARGCWVLDLLLGKE